MVATGTCAWHWSQVPVACGQVEPFFKLVKSSEEPLHEHREVTLLAFITRRVAIKSKYFFSNNYYNDLGETDM
jgi:hypothetical protein